MMVTIQRIELYINTSFELPYYPLKLKPSNSLLHRGLHILEKYKYTFVSSVTAWFLGHGRSKSSLPPGPIMDLQDISGDRDK
jgi:hypothetical protein